MEMGGWPVSDRGENLTIKTMEQTALRQQLKELMVEKLMLPMAANEIGDETMLFGPEGLGLDSIDALELVVALEKRYGVSIQNSETAARVLQNVNTMATHIVEQGVVS